MRHYVTVTTPSRTVRYSHVHVPIAEPPINGGQGWYFADFRWEPPAPAPAEGERC